MDRMDRPRPCVLCKARPVDPRYRPFCSLRCQLQDLGHWADGSYRVPGTSASPDEAPLEDDEHHL